MIAAGVGEIAVLVITILLVAGLVWFIVHVSKGKSADQKSAPPPSYERAEFRRTHEAPGQGRRQSGGESMTTPSFASRMSRTAAPGRWIPPGESVSIAGFAIDGGMIYVGGSLPAQYGGNDNCLIDPTLAVAGGGADVTGSSMGYWPAYERIGGTARRAYLQWLAGGRKAPDAYIGYVFLFFYGLERRLFVDNQREEAAALVDEVERLLTLYGENGSFNMYARRFLDVARLFSVGVPACEPTLNLRDGYEIPFGIRLALGEKLAKGEPFTADEALTWVLALPDCFPRRPVVRCFEHARALWRFRFDERFPSGLKVRIPKAQLKGVYRPASASFEAQLSMPDMPDIASVQAPLDGLRDLLHACADELDPYSRLLGRRPEAEGTPEALLLLPPALAASGAGSALQAIKETLATRLDGQELALVPLSEVMSTLGLTLDADQRLSPGAARQMGAMLDRLDLGFEPDRRYGPLSPAADGQIALFTTPSGGPIDPDRVPYVAARTLVEVAVLAAHADGVIVPAEFEAIATDLRGMIDLSAPERLRLLSMSLVLLKDPPKHQAAVNRLLKLGATERLQITESAISAVLADGRVMPEEVRFLERLHKALGLPRDQVYAALHRGGQRPDEPVTIAPETFTAGEKVPGEPAPEQVIVAFDPERLARIRQETSEVSKLLSGIFVEDEAQTESVPTKAAAQISRFEGLDAAHASLLASLLTTTPCDRSTFEASARALKLFPDGALETINEWGFEQFDEPVVEGEDIIAPVEHLRARLQAMGGMG